MHRVFVVIVAAGLLAAPLQAWSAPLPNVQSVDLKLQDIGNGWVLKGSKTLDNASAAAADRTTVAQEAQSGRLTGHIATFQLGPLGKYVGPDATSLVVLGLIYIQSRVDLFKSPVDVQAAYQQSVKQSPVAGAPPFKHLKLATVGVRHSAWTATQAPTKTNGLSLFVDVLVFYRGPYLVDVTVACQDLNNTAEVLKLARIVDGRIQHAAQ